MTERGRNSSQLKRSVTLNKGVIMTNLQIMVKFNGTKEYLNFFGHVQSYSITEPAKKLIQ